MQKMFRYSEKITNLFIFIKLGLIIAFMIQGFARKFWLNAQRRLGISPINRY